MERGRVTRCVSRLARMVGLGLCWASEELMTFSMAGLGGNGESSYLYAAYLPLLALAGIILAITPRLGMILEKPAIWIVAIGLGVLGILVLALFPQQGEAVLIGIALYAAGVAVVNVLWMRVFAALPARDARRCIVATAVSTMAALSLWALSTAGVLLAAAVLLVLSACAYGFAGLPVADEPRKNEGRAVSPMLRHGLRHWMAPAGVCVLMMGFGFLQYTAYHYGRFGTQPVSWEVVSHGLAVVLLAIAVYGTRDAEQTLGFKLATTLMLFSFVLLAVLWPDVAISATLAAATEGMLELVLLLAFVEYVGARDLSAVRAFGCYLTLVAGAQLVGCGLAVLDHALLPSASYSAAGLVLVALFIVTAVWLLNDKTITAFLWEGRMEPGGRIASKAEARTPQATFDERAQAVAVAFSLTARETEVMALFARGRSSSFIAETFCVSNNTVRSHILHLYAKCDVHSRQELITLIDEWEPSDS